MYKYDNLCVGRSKERGERDGLTPELAALKALILAASLLLWVAMTAFSAARDAAGWASI